MAETITWEQLRELAAFRATARLRGESLRGSRSEHGAYCGGSRIAYAVAARARRATAGRAARDALARRAEGSHAGSRADRGLVRQRVQPRGRPRRCRVRGGAGRPLSAASAAVAGGGRGPDRAASCTWRRSFASSDVATVRSLRTSDASAATSTGSAQAGSSRSRTRRRTSPAGTTRAAGRSRATSATSRRSSTGTFGTSPMRSIAASEGSVTFASCSPGRRRRDPASKTCSRRRHAGRSSGGSRPRRTSTRRVCSRRHGLYSRSGVPAERRCCSSAGARRPLGTAAPRPAGRRRSRLPPTAASSFCWCRTARTVRLTSVPSAAARRRTNGSCPLDGTTLQTVDTGLDLAVHQTLTHGRTIEVIGGASIATSSRSAASRRCSVLGSRPRLRREAAQRVPSVARQARPSAAVGRRAPAPSSSGSSFVERTPCSVSFPRLRKHAALERADRLVVRLDGAVEALAERDEVLGHDRQTLVELWPSSFTPAALSATFSSFHTAAIVRRSAMSIIGLARITRSLPPAAEQGRIGLDRRCGRSPRPAGT